MTAPRFCPLCTTPLVTRNEAGRDRLACPAEGCGFVFWDNPLPVVAAVLEHDGHVILVRNHGWPETWFGLVTGFLERGESPEEGVLREVREETGLDGEVAGLIGAYPFLRMNQVIIAFHVVARGEVVLGDEIADFRRVPVDRLRPWESATGEAVRDWLRRRGAEPARKAHLDAESDHGTRRPL